MRTLLHAFATFAVGGPQIRFAHIANALGGAYRHVIVAMDGATDVMDRLAPELDAELLPLPIQPGHSLRNLTMFRRVLRERRPDLLVTYNWGAIEWAIANLDGRVPHLHFEDGFTPEEVERQLRRRVVSRSLLLRRSTVVVPSRTLHAIARNSWRLPARHVFYVPNGIDCDRFAPVPDPAFATALGIPPGLPVVGTVAALRPEKNLGRLLDAFAAVLRHRPAVLAIVGDGPERAALEARARQLGIDGSVVFTGMCGSPERLLPSFDVFALSSDTEQMPLSALEAMAAGRAVAATDVGDVRAILAAENRPFVVAKDAAPLAQAICALLDDPARANAIGAANRSRARSLFDHRGVVAQYRRLFDGGVPVERPDEREFSFQEQSLVSRFQSSDDLDPPPPCRPCESRDPLLDESRDGQVGPGFPSGSSPWAEGPRDDNSKGFHRTNFHLRTPERRPSAQQPKAGRRPASEARSRMLFISPRFLFPLDEGGKIRTAGILRAMKGRSFDITLASPASSDTAAYAAEIASVCDRFAGWPQSSFGTARRLLSLAGTLPVSVAGDYAPAGAALVAREIANRPDLIVIDFPHTAVLLPPILEVPSVLCTHNVETEIFERRAAVSSGVSNLLWRREARRMRAFEEWALRRCGQVAAVSERDAGELRNRFGLSRVAVTGTGVDVGFYDFHPPRDSAQTVVFSGAMDSRSNIDGIEFLMEEVWPLVAAARPDARMLVVGRNPPPAVVGKAARRHLPWQFTGFVDDIRPHVLAGDVSVIPLRVGSGTRLKAFEAMALGRPVVSTTLGMEGLEVEPGTHFLQADGAAAFADAIVRLLDDAALRRRLVGAARRLVAERFSWSAVAARLEAACHAAIGEDRGIRSEMIPDALTPLTA